MLLLSTFLAVLLFSLVIPLVTVPFLAFALVFVLFIFLLSILLRTGRVRPRRGGGGRHRRPPPVGGGNTGGGEPEAGELLGRLGPLPSVSGALEPLYSLEVS